MRSASRTSVALSRTLRLTHRRGREQVSDVRLAVGKEVARCVLQWTRGFLSHTHRQRSIGIQLNAVTLPDPPVLSGYNWRPCTPADEPTLREVIAASDTAPGTSAGSYAYGLPS